MSAHEYKLSALKPDSRARQTVIARQYSTKGQTTMDWFQLEPPSNDWLVDGLITSDGHAAICGKPKAGKSTFVRNLITSVIKSNTLIGRAIDIPTGTGRVLYIHLDRKDQPGRVAEELRQLGITVQEAERLAFRTAQEMPEAFEERLQWIQKEAKETRPHLIVIDMLWQFVVAKNNNDYNAVIDGINKLQDAFINISYKGALVVTLHSRKANSLNEPFDDILGSTGQRGSFSTNIMLARRRKEGIYTVESDQTHRDDLHGEIPETVIEYVDGALRLGTPYSQLAQQEKAKKTTATLHSVLDFIQQHPGCEMKDILNGLRIAKKTVLNLLDKAGDLVSRTGEGEKGDPFKYSLKDPSSLPVRMEGAANDDARYFEEQQVAWKPI